MKFFEKKPTIFNEHPDDILDEVLRNTPHFTPFTPNKLSRCAALEVADQGVRVNAVNPGVIVTEVHKRAGRSTKGIRAGLYNKQLGRS